jgi:hypothetical protein
MQHSLFTNVFLTTTYAAMPLGSSGIVVGPDLSERRNLRKPVGPGR